MREVRATEDDGGGLAARLLVASGEVVRAAVRSPTGRVIEADCHAEPQKGCDASNECESELVLRCSSKGCACGAVGSLYAAFQEP